MRRFLKRVTTALPAGFQAFAESSWELCSSGLLHSE